ncbi:hypothetical protein SAMD00019534_024200 [Acytostelium subglobosum LB1]|uniref:hypothetical protein n=1 Tax=Acytostelium subglobosum LB1 TaxID=1410327 RepID=UPI000644E0C1|nr:hypothetical protein SAMD00019534_024200 [Acytostelium subglobosum LB1]GAM19245.1 hypothetical protein SAMD00019534_024200 [Acytostelium subglobosum LB1]|eukprot:XP_012757172.1 hypothetical protein SAMD00019534_024200 [Acytostelium subglobosum LB1]
MSSITNVEETTITSPPYQPSLPFRQPTKLGKKVVMFPVKSGNNTYQLEGFLSSVEPSHNSNISPEGVESPLSDIGIVITHPHPMLGGNYQNNVVLGVASYLTNHMHLPTLCFNFRGVGKSEGRGSWRGSYEQEDTLAAVRYLINEAPLQRRPKRVIIIGYSYGSVIGASVADMDDAIMAYAAISYPFGPLTLMLLGHLLDAAKSKKPKFFVIGDRDDFTGLARFRARIEEFPDPLESRIFVNVDHFYGGAEKQLAKELSGWINSLVFPTPTPVSLDSNNEEQKQQQS